MVNPFINEVNYIVLILTEAWLLDILRLSSHKYLQKQLIEFEQTKRHLELRERLFARFGPWPEDKRQADAAELKEHIATQEYYLENGVYPGEESLEKASSGDSSQPGKLNVGFFTVHTKNGARDLAEFIASRSNPPDSSEAIETENSNTTWGSLVGQSGRWFHRSSIFQRCR